MKNNFLLKSLEKNKINVIIIILLSLMNSYLLSLVPLFIKYALDGVVYNNEYMIPNYVSMFFWNTNIGTKLIIICTFLLIINFLMSLVKFIRAKMVSKFKIQINKNVRESILRKTRKLTYSSFLNTEKNKITQRTNSDINIFTSFLDIDLIMFFDLAFALFFSVFNTIKLNFVIGIYLIICMILLIFASIIYFKKSKILAKQVVSANENLTKKEDNLIKNIKMIKMYGRENIEKEGFLNKNNIYNEKLGKLINSNTFYHIITHIINITSVPFVITIGGIYIVSGSLSLGALVAILQYRASILERCSKLEEKFRNISQFYIAYKNLKKYIELPEDKETKKYKLEGDIVFENVSIYFNKNCVLKDLNFKIEKGKSYALVGDNGTGKSVLLKTILGLYEYSGNIFIGNKNLREVESSTIINNISFVSQEIFLFNTSIQENIVLGQENKDIVEIIKISEIYDEIVNTENGFNTIVNENLNLSGGQKQRIAIARALYQDRDYLLLDGALNKLDSNTKNKILNNLEMLNKTIVITTYDYNTINKLKNVLFINNKTITCSTNEILEKENDFYKKLIDISKNKLGEEYE